MGGFTGNILSWLKSIEVRGASTRARFDRAWTFSDRCFRYVEWNLVTAGLGAAYHQTKSLWLFAATVSLFLLILSALLNALLFEFVLQAETVSAIMPFWSRLAIAVATVLFGLGFFSALFFFESELFAAIFQWLAKPK